MFEKIATVFKDVPEWGTVAASVGLLIAAALVLVLIGKRKVYPPVAVIIGACGAFLVTCARLEAGEFMYVVMYVTLFIAAAFLFSALLLIPTPKRRKRDKMKEMEEKFHLELTEQPAESADVLPPKVCCFEDAPAAPAQAEELRLAHVSSLIAKLRASRLSATDRLELDTLSRTVDGYRGRPLTREEAGSLNDCLASVLKLTAKYKL